MNAPSYSKTTKKNSRSHEERRRWQNLEKIRRHRAPERAQAHDPVPQEEILSTPESGGTVQVRVLCIYPDTESAKMARNWICRALAEEGPVPEARIDYYSYAMLSQGGICWRSVSARTNPDVILILGNGKEPLSSGLRNSLHDLFSIQNGRRHPQVLFRNMEEKGASLNARMILDYVSALTRRNHCSMRAVDRSGSPLECYRQPQLLLRTRIRHE